MTNFKKIGFYFLGTTLWCVAIVWLILILIKGLNISNDPFGAIGLILAGYGFYWLGKKSFLKGGATWIKNKTNG